MPGPGRVHPCLKVSLAVCLDGRGMDFCMLSVNDSTVLVYNLAEAWELDPLTCLIISAKIGLLPRGTPMISTLRTQARK